MSLWKKVTRAADAVGDAAGDAVDWVGDLASRSPGSVDGLKQVVDYILMNSEDGNNESPDWRRKLAQWQEWEKKLRDFGGKAADDLGGLMPDMPKINEGESDGVADPGTLPEWLRGAVDKGYEGAKEAYDDFLQRPGRYAPKGWQGPWPPEFNPNFVRAGIDRAPATMAHLIAPGIDLWHQAGRNWQQNHANEGWVPDTGWQLPGTGVGPYASGREQKPDEPWWEFWK